MFWLIIGLVVSITLLGLAIAYNNDPDNADSKLSKSSILGFFLAPLIMALLIASITTVGTGQIAVMTRFGRVTGQELGEGLHFKFPLDKANKYDVKVLRDGSKATAASKDLQDVNADVVVNYRLQSGKVSEIHKTVGPEYKAKILEPAVQEVFKASTAKFDATQLITNRSSAKNQVTTLLRERLEKYGIVVVDVSLTNFTFSKEFTAAIESKQVAQQNAERAKFNLEAARTDAQAQEVQARTLSPLFLQKQAIEKWNGKMPTYIGNGTVFNIPLGR